MLPLLASEAFISDNEKYSKLKVAFSGFDLGTSCVETTTLSAELLSNVLVEGNLNLTQINVSVVQLTF